MLRGLSAVAELLD